MNASPGSKVCLLSLSAHLQLQFEGSRCVCHWIQLTSSGQEGRIVHFNDEQKINSPPGSPAQTVGTQGWLLDCCCGPLGPAAAAATPVVTHQDPETSVTLKEELKGKNIRCVGSRVAAVGASKWASAGALVWKMTPKKTCLAGGRRCFQAGAPFSPLFPFFFMKTDRLSRSCAEI